MPKEEWGVKRVCPTTGKRFYDLNKSPIVSPYTGEVVQLETGGATKSRTPIKEEPAKKKQAEDAEVIEDDQVVEEEDSEVSLGDDVLEDDDEDNVSLDDIADVGSEEDES
ncbi:MAG: TIGR02300 family protein [Deinococcus-Thermus bacterium]|jgi:uncharacterized protein (TIGR02300 family)|nr:TIGR02300 family protein [Deinococcota bacterium]